MKYIQVEIKTNRAGLEPVMTVLMEMGILNIVVEDPAEIEQLMEKKHDYDWDYVAEEVLKLREQEPKIIVYLDMNEKGRDTLVKIKEAMEALKQMGEEGDFGAVVFKDFKVESTIRDDQDWKDLWKEYFKPTRIGNRLVVKPTWEKYEKENDDIVIEIDPGMAFGTGTHETTSLCMNLMEKYMKEGDRVLDVGCGSGILTIGAALLGANKVLGIEIDPVAVEIAKKNLELNGVRNIAKIIEGDLTKGVEYQADVVVANLMADLVIRLSEDVGKSLKSEGFYISSGILDEKAENVSTAIKNAGFEIVEIKKDGMWCAIVARKTF